MDKIYLGSHVNLSSTRYYEDTVNTAVSFGANTFMFYTGAPQNTFRKPLNELFIEEGRALIKKYNLNEDKIIVHAPYIINLGNSTNPKTRDLAISFLLQELKRVEAFHIKTLVLHPGSHVGAGTDIGIKSIIDGLNEIFEKDHTNVVIALETMSGKGSELGSTFRELKAIIDGVKHKERLGVCLDTCHMSDAGYNVDDIDSLLEEFNNVVGLNKIKCIHINDSLNPTLSHKDRHANIGFGYIGFDTLVKYVYHPLLEGIPKILETPYINGEPPYKKEIQMIKDKVFDKNIFK